MSGSGSDNKPVPGAPQRSAVDSFIETAARLPKPDDQGGRGRLIFALDATMSRQPTWDLAQSLQAKMFETAASLGGLDVQLVYFRGFGECRASSFVSGGRGLSALMAQIQVRGGHTQIGKILAHVACEARAGRVGALVYVGDAMEERIDDLSRGAGEIALLGVKAFMFQEGSDGLARTSFQEIARLTGGAYAVFDQGAAARLAALLAAAAAYAAGGRPALEAQASDPTSAARLLLRQMR